MTNKKTNDNKKLINKRIFAERIFALILEYIRYFQAKKNVNEASYLPKKTKQFNVKEILADAFQMSMEKLLPSPLTDLIEKFIGSSVQITRSISEKAKASIQQALKNNKINSKEAKLIGRAVDKTINNQNTLTIINQIANPEYCPRHEPIPVDERAYEEFLTEQKDKMPDGTNQERFERDYTSLLYRNFANEFLKLSPKPQRSAKLSQFKNLINVIEGFNLFQSHQVAECFQLINSSREQFIKVDVNQEKIFEKINQYSLFGEINRADYSQRLSNMGRIESFIDKQPLNHNRATMGDSL